MLHGDGPGWGGHEPRRTVRHTKGCGSVRVPRAGSPQGNTTFTMFRTALALIVADRQPICHYRQAPICVWNLKVSRLHLNGEGVLPLDGPSCCCAGWTLSPRRSACA